jgi:hypothetical protein
MTDTQINIQREKGCTMYENKSLALRVYETKTATLIYRIAPATFSRLTISREQAASALRDMRKARK